MLADSAQSLLGICWLTDLPLVNKNHRRGTVSCRHRDTQNKTFIRSVQAALSSLHGETLSLYNDYGTDKRTVLGKVIA